MITKMTLIQPVIQTIRMTLITRSTGIQTRMGRMNIGFRLLAPTKRLKEVKTSRIPSLFCVFDLYVYMYLIDLIDFFILLVSISMFERLRSTQSLGIVTICFYCYSYLSFIVGAARSTA